MKTDYSYKRRKSRPVKVGNIIIGGDNPLVIQSMTNTSTLDTEGSAAQAGRMAEAGAQLVRLTTQGVREADNLAAIRARLNESGCEVPLSADVHFNPKAAFAAAQTADKVRINPGNFAAGDKIRATFVPFLELCASRGVAVRLGVNHGSLSERIMSQYGDTPEGMVESAMEYLRIAREIGFNDIVVSIKASNTLVMVQTVRLLSQTMEAEGMDYPLHLGVTEAGDAEDGRIKSAVGIGALLHEGLGDTIRVSLSEPPENELPVAAALRDYISLRANEKPLETDFSALPGEPRSYADIDLEPIEFRLENPPHIGELKLRIDRYIAEGGKRPVTIVISYTTESLEELRVQAGADMGAMLLAGYGEEIRVEDPHFEPDLLRRLEADIMQASRRRFYKTEYIACPSCGRTLFDLPATLRQVKEAMAGSGFDGLKIGVMGCIVNGPGEMADADYGYVGAGPGRVSIYRGKELVIRNIPTDKALDSLLELISQDRQRAEAANEDQHS